MMTREIKVSRTLITTCDRCKAESVTELGSETSPEIWEHAQKPTGWGIVTKKHNGNTQTFQFDFCGVCMDSFINWQLGLPITRIVQ